MKIYLGILCVLCTWSVAYSQQTNPFDLQFRLNQTQLQASPDSIDTIQSMDKTADSLGTLPMHDTLTSVKSPAQPDKPNARDSLSAPDSTQHNDSARTQNMFNEDNPPDIKAHSDSTERDSTIALPDVLQKRNNLIFITFLILLIMLTLVITSDRSVVDHVFRAFMNDNYLNLLYREQRGKSNIQYLFLYFFFIANLGFFIFLSLDHWLTAGLHITLLTCILVAGIIYIARHLAMRLIAYLFPIEKEANQFNFTIIIFNILLGLILLPINLFLAFAPGSLSELAFYIGLGIIGLFYLFRQLRGLFISARFISSSQFHFFVYLCTVEIAPLLVGVKLFMNLTS